MILKFVTMQLLTEATRDLGCVLIMNAYRMNATVTI